MKMQTHIHKHTEMLHYSIPFESLNWNQRVQKHQAMAIQPFDKLYFVTLFWFCASKTKQDKSVLPGARSGKTEMHAINNSKAKSNERVFFSGKMNEKSEKHIPRLWHKSEREMGSVFTNQVT